MTQAMRDALADAATLRQVAHDVAQHCYGGGWDGETCAPCDAAVRALRIYCPLADGDHHSGFRLSAAFYADPFVRAADVFGARAMEEAHSAFRAVPGLRDDF